MRGLQLNGMEENCGNQWHGSDCGREQKRWSSGWLTRRRWVGGGGGCRRTKGVQESADRLYLSPGWPLPPKQSAVDPPTQKSTSACALSISSRSRSRTQGCFTTTQQAVNAFHQWADDAVAAINYFPSTTDALAAEIFSHVFWKNKLETYL